MCITDTFPKWPFWHITYCQAPPPPQAFCQRKCASGKLLTPFQFPSNSAIVPLCARFARRWRMFERRPDGICALDLAWQSIISANRSATYTNHHQHITSRTLDFDCNISWKVQQIQTHPEWAVHTGCLAAAKAYIAVNLIGGGLKSSAKPPPTSLSLQIGCRVSPAPLSLWIFTPKHLWCAKCRWGKPGGLGVVLHFAGAQIIVIVNASRIWTSSLRFHNY